jgi:hypothetical protein
MHIYIYIYIYHLVWLTHWSITRTSQLVNRPSQPRVWLNLAHPRASDSIPHAPTCSRPSRSAPCALIELTCPNQSVDPTYTVCLGPTWLTHFPWSLKDGNLDPGIGSAMGIIFYPRVGPIPNPSQCGYGHGYFFSPVGNPSGTQN